MLPIHVIDHFNLLLIHIISYHIIFFRWTILIYSFVIGRLFSSTKSAIRSSYMQHSMRWWLNTNVWRKLGKQCLYSLHNNDDLIFITRLLRWQCQSYSVDIDHDVIINDASILRLSCFSRQSTIYGFRCSRWESVFRIDELYVRNEFRFIVEL
jgi:hypothetical protein